MDLLRTPSFRLDGKCALVAGASSGIGLACAAALAEAGAEVALVARREEELRALAQAVPGVMPPVRHQAFFLEVPSDGRVDRGGADIRP